MTCSTRFGWCESTPSCASQQQKSGLDMMAAPSVSTTLETPLPLVELLSRWPLLLILLAVLSLAISVPAHSKKPDHPSDESADEFLIVDCLLPGQLRKLGSRMNYLSPRRPIKTSASDCEIRGGEYVAFDRADYSTALKIWLPQAKEGDPVAQTYVGEIYEKGLGLDPDYQFAAYWYQQAVQQGHSRALINLGHLYELGLGVERDPRKALNLYREASGIDGDQLLFASSLVSSHVPIQQHQSVKGELAKQKQHSEALEQEMAELNKDVQRRTAALQRAESELTITAEQLAAATAVSASGGVVNAEPGENELRMEAELQSLEAQKFELEQQLASLEQKNSALQSEHSAIVSDLERSRNAEQERLAVLQEDMLRSKAQLQQSEREAEALKQELARLQSSQTASSASVATLQQELDAKNEQLASAQDRFQQLESSSQAQQKQLQATSDQLTSQSQQVSSTSAEYQQQKSQLSGELLQREQQLQKTSHQLLLARAALQMERANSARALETQSSAQKAELARQQEKLAQLSEQLEKQSAQVSQQKQKIDELELESESYSDAEVAAAAAAEPQVAVLEQAPRIEIIEPPVVLVRSMPTVKLLSRDGERQVVGKVMAPAGIVSLSVNGKPVELANNNLFRASIPIDTAPKPVNVVVVDSQGRRAAVAFTFVADAVEEGKPTAQVAVAGKSKTSKKVRQKLGDYYALIIGNNDYQQFSTLATAMNDARETERVLRKKYNFKTRLLLNADRYTILSALNELRETLDADDNLLIYYAGHGIMDEENGRGYWLPVDADTNNNANWISNTAVTDILNVISAKHILVVADSCFSGTLTQSPLSRAQTDVPSDLRSEWIEVMAETRARITLTSGGLEPVLDGGGGDHSLFAKAFLAALESNEGILEGYSLYYQVLDRMNASVQSLAGGEAQVPQYAPIHLAGHESGEFFFSPI